MFKQLIDAICFRLINGPLSGPAPLEFRISKLELRPGDLVVIRFKLHLAPEQVARFCEAWKGIVPNNKIIIFDRDVDLSVLSAPAELPAAA